MHKRIVCPLIVLAFASFIFSSYEHGPAYEAGLNRSGSAGGTGNCAGSGCHPANQSSTIASIEVKDAGGNIVTQYTPGGSYTVSISGTNTSSEDLSAFGFQVSPAISGHLPGGTLSAISGTKVRVVTVGALQVAEHKSPIDETAHNTYNASFKWTAPAPGSGNVTFYGVLNAVNGEEHKATDHGNNDNDNNNNGDDDDDDLTDTYPNAAPNLVLTEGAVNSVPDVSNAPVISCFPNPFTTEFELDIQNMKGLCEVSVCDMVGRVVLRESMLAGVGALTVHTAHLPAGRYYLRLVNENNSLALPVVKL